MRKKNLNVIMACVLILVLCNGLFAAARLDTVQGKVTINGIPAKAGQQLNKNDVIKTASKAVSVIEINGHKVAMAARTETILTESDGEVSLIKIIVGKIRATVQKLQAKQKFEIKTPTAVCAVRGTDFSVDVAEDGLSRVEVYEGLVSAREETTGAEVMVNPGEFTTVQKGEAPKQPEKIEQQKVQDQRQPADFKSETQREIFMEISRDSVMQRAAEEIKLSEYQNGKALIDVYGKRVRLEEYIYRPQDNKNQFKYVVLNERENRFDFGKILFTFNKDLPANLNDATKYMFHKDGATAPEWYLTSLDSVMSNTYDKILEEASGGKMVSDDPLAPTQWNLFFPNYKFYIGNENSTENGGRGKLMWQYADNGDNTAQAGEFTFLPGTAYESSADPAVVSFNKMPGGKDLFHFAYRDLYADGTWVEKHNYVIDDNGKVQSVSDVLGTSENITADKLKNKILSLNFQNVYTSSLFEDKYSADDGHGKRIDLIFSSKLLSDSGILQLPSALNE